MAAPGRGPSSASCGSSPSCKRSSIVPQQRCQAASSSWLRFRARWCATRSTCCATISLGLSPVAVNEVYDLLGRARNDGLAVVLVEQNVKRALAESDRYYCIQKGRVVLEGASESADQAQVAQAYFGI